MPTYRYACACGEFDEWKSIHVLSAQAACPVCGESSPKVLVPPFVSAAALPNRSRCSAPPAGNRNSWEAGRVTDHRGAPLRGEKGTPITVKEYAANRSKYEERRRFLATHPDPFNARKEQAQKDGTA